MAEMYASRAVGGTALGLSIGAIGAELLTGGLNGLLGNGGRAGGNSSENMAVSRYEMGLEKDLAAKDSKIALLEASIYTDGKLNDFRNYVDNKFSRVESELCDQRVFNATTVSNLTCVQGQIAQLMGLVQLKIPNSSVCPGWGDVAVSVTPATAAAG